MVGKQLKRTKNDHQPMLLLVVVVLSLCVNQVYGLQVKIPNSINTIAHRHSHHKKIITKKCMSPIDTILPMTKYILAVPAMYSLMSVNEYITHRYYQHLEITKVGFFKNILKSPKKIVDFIKTNGHVEHHAETLDDMSLRMDAKWLDAAPAKVLDNDVYRGTAFSWPSVFLMTLQMLPTTIPVFLTLGFSLGWTFGFLLVSMSIHTLIWNALHPG
jgi:hypothetical protein